MPELVVVGSYVQDLTFRAERFPAPGETRLATCALGPGGKGSNQAVAAHRLGVDTLFIGAVGDDVFARGYEAFAKSEGLATALEIIPDATTGTASIVVDSQARNLITVAPGANDRLSVGHVERHRAEIEGARVVLVQLEANLVAAQRALEIARAAGAITIVNPAPIHPGVSSDLLRLGNIVTPNETEFSFLLQRLHARNLSGEWWKDNDEALHELCGQLGVPIVALTLGADGCFLSRRDGSAPRPVERIPAAKVNPCDTTGAGDAFSGALAAGLIHFDGDVDCAVRLATHAAGLSTEVPGAAPSMPTLAMLEKRYGIRV